MPYSSTREIADVLREGEGEEFSRIIAELDAKDMGGGITALDVLRYDWPAWARDEQLPPDEQIWRYLFLRWGRGSGKTRAGAEMTINAARNPDDCGGRIYLVAPTHGDIRVTMVEGTSGILACSPPWFMPEWQPGIGNGGRLRWPCSPAAAGHSTAAGGQVVGHCFSAAKPERIRGPEAGWVWGDEIAAWGRNGMVVHDLLVPGLRFGKRPRCLYTSTPAPTPLVEMLDAEAEAELVEISEGKRDRRRRTTIQRVASTFANAANLPAATIEELHRRYSGTTRGRQELEAELIKGDPRAMWQLEIIVASWIAPEDVPPLVEIVISIDNATTENPPGTLDMSTPSGRNRNVGSNDTGIGAVGLGDDGIIYILDDWTCNTSPAGWAQIALEAFASPWTGNPGQRANKIVAEKNAGGDLIRRNITAFLEAENINTALVPIEFVNAKDGKWARADPVHMLYEKLRVRHVHRALSLPGAVGRLDDLEYQQCRFRRAETGVKRDRVDWAVWGVTHFLDTPSAKSSTDRARALAASYVR